MDKQQRYEAKRTRRYERRVEAAQALGISVAELIRRRKAENSQPRKLAEQDHELMDAARYELWKTEACGRIPSADLVAACSKQALRALGRERARQLLKRNF
jgi:hypothetical protein